MDLLIATNSVNSGGADAPPSSGTPQFATDGAPPTIPPTQFPAYHYNGMMKEIYNVIVAAAITPSRFVFNQLLLAIQQLINNALTAEGFGTAAFKTATDNTQPDVISISGAVVIGNIPKFKDTAGTCMDSGVALPQRYSSGNQTWGTSSELGPFACPFYPDVYFVEAVCIAVGGDGGYLQNEAVKINHENSRIAGGLDQGVSLSLDAANNITVNIASTITITPKGGGSGTNPITITNAKWDLRVRAIII